MTLKLIVERVCRRSLGAAESLEVDEGKVQERGGEQFFYASGNCKINGPVMSGEVALSTKLTVAVRARQRSEGESKR